MESYSFLENKYAVMEKAFLVNFCALGEKIAFI